MRELSLEDTRQSGKLLKELARREKERRDLLLQIQQCEAITKAREQELEEERIRSRNRNEEAEQRLEEARIHEEKWRALKRENKVLRKQVQQLREQLEDQALLHQQHIPVQVNAEKTAASSDSDPEHGKSTVAPTDGAAASSVAPEPPAPSSPAVPPPAVRPPCLLFHPP